MKPEQVEELLKPIDPARVGKDGKGFSHVEAWDIRKRMNQIFGFGNWSAEVLVMELIYEAPDEKNGKTRFSVGYRAQCRVTVGGAVYTEWAAGDAVNPTRADAHDQAIKTAESQAFKRCCVNLGDQFGLSLYKDGSVAATVGDIVGREHADDARADDLRALLDGVTTAVELEALLPDLRAADFSAAIREELISAYRVAQQRISPPVPH